MAETIYQFSAKSNSGENVSLGEYRGKVLLVVNTASECGFTEQYEGLEQLYGEFKGRGFAVLAFPCNQFGGQEPGSDAAIAAFCQARFATTFPLFAKVEVNGEGAHPLFTFLKEQASGFLGSKAIKWNFTKFLVDGEGRVVKRFAPKATPKSLRGEIEALVGEAQG